MTRVVTDKCIDCKITSCVTVCPVDAFHEGENTLVINPATCIDCSLCEDECPIGAIIPESSDHELMDDFLEFAEDKSDSWPIITIQQDPMNSGQPGVVGKWANRSHNPAPTD